MISCRKTGFTLVEIMVVVVIMGIAAAIAVPYMASTSNVKVQSAARILMADLFYAQNLAITSQVQVDVVFTISSTSSSFAVQQGGAAVLGPDRSTMSYTFGGTTGPTPFQQTRLNSVSIAGASTATISTASAGTVTLSFNSLGEPLLNVSGTVSQLTALTGFTDGRGVSIVLAGGTAANAPTMTLAIQPYTGEISVQ